MSNPPLAPEYPPQHPHHGQPYYVVHDHDVLCGRGVNIASHPGNERFRALVNKRYDPNYCTTFSTCEKKALAVEIVNHIKSLNPPGRFLKRSGRSTSSRGLHGPWEELSMKDCIRKACQALRDGNRGDRTGYASSIAVPEDVKYEADERTGSGLSLKEHAASVVARSIPAGKASGKKKPPPKTSGEAETIAAAAAASRDPQELPKNGIAADAAMASEDDLSHTVTRWAKRQRTNESLPGKEMDTPASISFDDGHVFAAAVATKPSSGGHITPPAPANYVAPAPVTTTPMMHPYQLHRSEFSITDQPTVASSDPPHFPPSPARDPTVDSTEAAAAPYSPVIWDRQHLEEDDDEVAIGDWKPHPYDPEGDHHQPGYDVLQSAVAAASALSSELRDGEYPLLSGDDVPHRSLNLSELD